VPFVVDDFLGWLVGLLADAGRRKLTALILGPEQERELRKAIATAVRRVASELCSDSEARAEELAMVISQVFAESPLAPSREASSTLLETLQAGIARQLSVLDDAGLTGTGQSSAEILGASAAVVASRLTGHLAQEIIYNGTSGGPLGPLAAQLNHDVTHLQGRRLQDMTGQLATEVRHGLTLLNTELSRRPAQPFR
jgi:hypothetical protein